MTLAALTQAWGAGNASSRPASAGAIPMYTAADESASPIGALDAGEHAIPIAETQGADGVKWFLVKNRSGVVGWITP